MHNDFIEEEDEDNFHDQDKSFKVTRAKKNFKRGYQKEFTHKRSNHHVPKQQETES